MSKRLAILIGVAAAGLVAFGAQTVTAAPRANVCKIVNGVELVQKGSATCVVDGTNSAMAVGAGSTATATGGTGNTAKAIGDESDAFAIEGSSNTATVIGDNSTALADHGNNNTAKVIGDDSEAAAGSEQIDARSNNTATVIGDGSFAAAQDPAGCTALARGDGVSDICPPR